MKNLIGRKGGNIADLDMMLEREINEEVISGKQLDKSGDSGTYLFKTETGRLFEIRGTANISEVLYAKRILTKKSRIPVR